MTVLEERLSDPNRTCADGEFHDADPYTSTDYYDEHGEIIHQPREAYSSSSICGTCRKEIFTMNQGYPDSVNWESWQVGGWRICIDEWQLRKPYAIDEEEPL